MSVRSPKIYPWNSKNPIWNYDSQHFISIPHEDQSDATMKDVNGKSFRNPSFPHTVVDTFIGSVKVKFDKYLVYLKPNEFREIYISTPLKGFKADEKFLVVFYHLDLRKICNRLRNNPQISNVNTVEDLKQLMSNPIYRGRKVLIKVDKP